AVQELRGGKLLPAEPRRCRRPVDPDLLQPGDEVLRHVPLSAELVAALCQFGQDVVECHGLADDRAAPWGDQQVPPRVGCARPYEMEHASEMGRNRPRTQVIPTTSRGFLQRRWGRG